MKKCLTLLAALGAFAPVVSLQAADPKPLNFLFILTDDQRWDALGVVQEEQGDKARFPWLKTPNLDRLAREGTRFRNAFVTNALCSPSRACFLTGRYNHLNGVANNKTPLPTDSATFATLLHNAGYSTGYFGKWHMGNQEERPGFGETASFLGQGSYFNTRILVNGQPTVTENGRWVDDVTTDYALAFLQNQKDKPFLAVVGFKSPHGPRQPADTEKDLYQGEVPRDVPNLETITPYNAAVGRERGGPPGENLRNYFRLITGADRNVGRLLDALKELKLDENTVVVFAGDNGYFLGEHGLGDKRAAYEESLRIPLLVRFPGGKAGATVDQSVLNIDLAPTLLDLAGVAIPPSVQGRSFRPLLEGQAPADWRTVFLYEYFFEGTQVKTPTILAVRADDAKLVTYPGHPEWTEVFDLSADPYEVRNLAAPAGSPLNQRLEAELARQKSSVGYVTPSFADPDLFGVAEPKKREGKREKAGAE